MTKAFFDASSLSIIIVNYNSWSDLIECIESIYSSNSAGYKVVVCDNASNDDSVQKLLDWVDGTLEISFQGPQKHENYVTCKPENYLHINAEGIETGDYASSLIVIETGANLGFAGGNNVGLRYALDKTDSEYFWLLNADTTICDNAIDSIVLRMRGCDVPGMCGSIVKFYYSPDTIQALNGSIFNKWTGNSSSIGARIKAKEVDKYSRETVENNTDFVMGASLCVTRHFLDQVGLMEESYFLYYEEIDWSTRADSQFKIGFAQDCIVYHKEGGAIGSSSKRGARSALSEYYLVASKLKFTGKFFWYILPVTYVFSVLQICIRLYRRQFKNANVILRALCFRSF
jgi:GT2 family glycosyltransferase